MQSTLKLGNGGRTAMITRVALLCTAIPLGWCSTVEAIPLGGLSATLSGNGINWGATQYTEDWVGHSQGTGPVIHSGNDLGAAQYVQIEGGGGTTFNLWASITRVQSFTVTQEGDFLLNGGLSGYFVVSLPTPDIGGGTSSAGTATAHAVVSIYNSSFINFSWQKDPSLSKLNTGPDATLDGAIVDEVLNQSTHLTPGNYYFSEYLEVDITGNHAQAVVSWFEPVPDTCSTPGLLACAFAAIAFFKHACRTCSH